MAFHELSFCVALFLLIFLTRLTELGTREADFRFAKIIIIKKREFKFIIIRYYGFLYTKSH